MKITGNPKHNKHTNARIRQSRNSLLGHRLQAGQCLVPHQQSRAFVQVTRAPTQTQQRDHMGGSVQILSGFHVTRSLAKSQLFLGNAIRFLTVPLTQRSRDGMTHRHHADNASCGRRGNNVAPYWNCPRCANTDREEEMSTHTPSEGNRSVMNETPAVQPRSTLSRGQANKGEQPAYRGCTIKPVARHVLLDVTSCVISGRPVVYRRWLETNFRHEPILRPSWKKACDLNGVYVSEYNSQAGRLRLLSPCGNKMNKVWCCKDKQNVNARVHAHP